jgi:hypothetical protein
MNKTIPWILRWSALLLLPGATAADPIITEVSSATQFTYADDVSSSDLLNGLTPTTTGWNFGNEASPNELTDGIHGADFNVVAGDRVQGGWTTVGATAEYNLGTGANDLGFDLTSMVSIADWINVGFGNQVWTLEVKPVGGSYRTLVGVDNQALGAGVGTTKVTLTDDSGVLASGVEFIKITVGSQIGHTSGAFVWRELDAFGVDTVGGPDLTPPTVSTFGPVAGTTGVSPAGNLVVTFDENIVIGTGDITIKDLETPSQTVIPVGDARVSVSGAVLTINPSTNLNPNTNYAIQIDATAIDDTAGNSFAGFSDDTIWNFTTGATAVVKVFLLGGQSNSVGQASSTGLPTTPVNFQQPQGDIQFYYDGASLTTLRPGSGGNPPPSGLQFGPEVTFGRAIADASPSVDYAIIKHGENGTALYNDWAPGTGASYAAFRDTVTAGLAALQAAGYTTEIVGMLWHQGESDAIEGRQANYQNNLTAFIADVRTRYGASLPFLIGEIRRSNGPAFVTVADAQMAVAADDPNARFVPASDLTFSDIYHFDAPGMITLGKRFAEGFAVLTNGPGDTSPPILNALSPADGSTQVPLAGDLVLTFDEEIAIGTGNITIKDLDTPSQTVITLPDARVSVSGAELTINPSSNFAITTNHAVQIDGGAVTDLSGNPFVGIADDTTWNFTTAAEPLRIMCLGDSITVGYTDNPGWANHPFMFGYRSGLYTRLTNANYNFQFVGASTEPWTGISGDPTNGGTYAPAFDLRDFGQDAHRGYGGAGIWGNVNAWIAADNPDVILLLIGINGISANSPAALNTLVNSIVTTAPEVQLIVAQITPRVSFNQSLYNYNVYIRDTLVPTYATNGHKVTTVDLYTPFLVDPNNYASAIKPGVLSNNINHPDNVHYDLMAQEWFEGIEALGLGPDNFSSWISDPAYHLDPADRGVEDDPDHDGLANGIEAWFGTNPSEFNAGFAEISFDGTTGVLSHPRNDEVPSDLSAVYQWSSDLVNWYPNGSGPAGGAIGTFSAGTVEGLTILEFTSSEPLPKTFVRIKVTR